MSLEFKVRCPRCWDWVEVEDVRDFVGVDETTRVHRCSLFDERRLREVVGWDEEQEA
jgi:phage FluMu protein Com